MTTQENIDATSRPERTWQEKAYRFFSILSSAGVVLMTEPERPRLQQTPEATTDMPDGA